jgi:hypothetical protein
VSDGWKNKTIMMMIRYEIEILPPSTKTVEVDGGFLVMKHSPMYPPNQLYNTISNVLCNTSNVTKRDISYVRRHNNTMMTCVVKTIHTKETSLPDTKEVNYKLSKLIFIDNKPFSMVAWTSSPIPYHSIECSTSLLMDDIIQETVWEYDKMTWIVLRVSKNKDVQSVQVLLVGRTTHNDVFDDVVETRKQLLQTLSETIFEKAA